MSYRVYLCGPITGLDRETACAEREWFTQAFAWMGIETLDPMRWDRETYFSTREDAVAEQGEAAVYEWDKAIVARDKSDVCRSDVVLADFRNSKRVSIGSVVELGWADAFGIPVVTIMEPGNLHDHGFVHQLSAFVTADAQEAVKYVETLLNVSDKRG